MCVYSFLVLTCLLLVIALAMIYTITACRLSRTLHVNERDNDSIHYRLLTHQEGSINNLIGSESDDEQHA
jgi:hypothetical protein